MPARPASANTPSAMLAESGPEWLAAVARRRSRRAYDGTPAASALLDELETACVGFRPYADARGELVRAPSVDVFTGVIGSYGKVRDAPHLLVLIGDERSEFADQHVGYTGEAIVLEATRLGLDTCWVGGFFSAKRVARLVALGAGERAFAVSPIGRATQQAGLGERSLRGVSGAHSRKPVAEIAPDADASWPEWAIAAIETARLAPSAVNRQPWRFRIESGGLVVAKDNNRELPRVTKRLDCGIAMLHAQLGAGATGVVGEWADLAGLDVARFDLVGA